jgi:soluble lytic murein transglycosylase-like protein
MELPGTGQMDAVLGRAMAAGEEARLRVLETKPTAHTRQDLARTAREFESVFLDILMRSMRETVPDSDLMGSGGATKIYRQMHDSEMARAVAGTGGGLGIARLLESHFADAFADDPGGESVEVAGALAAPTAGRGLPASLALSRYRQNGGTAAVEAALSTPPSSIEPRLGLPASDPIAIAPETAPAAAVREQADDPRRQPQPFTTASVATSPSTTQSALAPATAPARSGLVPTDRRLANAPMAAAEADTVRRFGPAIDKAAASSGLDPRLVLAVVMEESGGNPAARSTAGARGLMQLMPGTARDLGVKNTLDPAANLDGGARYLAAQLDRFDGRLDLALAAYNSGPGNVERAGDRVPQFTETRNYVNRVLERYTRLRSGTDLDTGQR